MSRHGFCAGMRCYLGLGFLLLAVSTITAEEIDVENPLLGVWNAKLMQVGGKALPEKDIERVRFSFQTDTVLIRGNFGDDREEKLKYAIDLKKTPHEIDLRKTDGGKTGPGIFKVDGDELTLCVLHVDSEGQRPSEFQSPADSMIVFILLTRQKP